MVDDDALHRKFQIRRADDKAIESTKVNTFKQLTKGNHKRLAIVAHSEVYSDLWMSRFTINFERAANNASNAENKSVTLPIPGLTRLQAEKFRHKVLDEKKTSVFSQRSVSQALEEVG